MPSSLIAYGVLGLAAIIGLGVIAGAIYSSGKQEREVEILQQNDSARTGADGYDDRVVACPRGMFDYRTGKCAGA